MKFKILTLVIMTLIGASKANGQSSITLNDAKEINYQVEQTMRDFNDLMHYITNPKSKKGLVITAIQGSYDTTSKYNIFYDKKVNVESDLSPASALGKATDVSIEKYLTDVNIYTVGEPYYKLINISNIKTRDYLFVRVRFDFKFNKSKSDEKSYSIKQREALIRVVGTADNKWKALIKSISFYDPSKAAEDKSIAVNIDSTKNSRAADSTEVAIAVKKDSLLRAEVAKRQDQLINDYLRKADSLKNRRQFKFAKDLVMKAKDIRPFSPAIDVVAYDIDRLIEENTYEYLRNHGDIALREHRYEDAVQLYSHAMEDPKGKDLEAVLNTLTKKINDISLPKNRLQGGDFKGAIEECDKILGLKIHKNDKNAYPELYFIKGAAFEKLGEYKKALENYDLAITYFPKYTAALMARAQLNITFKKDYSLAITDYDVLGSSALDDAPEKPGYYITKARWKTIVGNNAGALADYSIAISLKPEEDSLYTLRGKYLFLTKNFADAQKDFDIAIQQNPKSNTAHYFRGLNYVELKDYKSAGLDFSEALALKIRPEWSARIDSISNLFFADAQNLVGKRDFVNADSSFNNALKIKPCNAQAWHGKAEICFLEGEDLNDKKKFDGAKQLYVKSIAFNKQAIVCNPDFSDAFYKEGLAQQRIGENETAIISFSEAIRSDKTKTLAFIERGNTQQTLHQYAKAVQDYQDALALLQTELVTSKKNNDKENTIRIINYQSMVNQLLGAAHYRLHDLASSLNALNEAITISQTNTEALYYRGLVYYDQGDASKSIDNLEQAIKLQAADYRLYYANGKAYQKKGRYSEAITNFTNAIRLDTGNMVKDKYYQRAINYFRNKAVEDAVSDFTTYGKSENSKTDTSFFADYGVAQLLTNRDTAALSSFTRGLALNAAHSKALYGMGCYYVKAKLADKSLEYFAKAFNKHELKADDIKPLEEAVVNKTNMDKANLAKYKELRKTYFSNKEN